MGFETLQAFDEITNSPDNVSQMINELVAYADWHQVRKPVMLGTESSRMSIKDDAYSVK